MFKYSISTPYNPILPSIIHCAIVCKRHAADSHRRRVIAFRGSRRREIRSSLDHPGRNRTKLPGTTRISENSRETFIPLVRTPYPARSRLYRKYPENATCPSRDSARCPRNLLLSQYCTIFFFFIKFISISIRC